MYAITIQPDGTVSWRGVEAIEDLQPGEVAVEHIPENPVWDAAVGALRSESPTLATDRRTLRHWARRTRRERLAAILARLERGEEPTPVETRETLRLLLRETLSADS